MHYAADAGHVEVVKYLVRMGAETTIEDKVIEEVLNIFFNKQQFSQTIYLNQNVFVMIGDSTKDSRSHFLQCLVEICESCLAFNINEAQLTANTNRNR